MLAPSSPPRIAILVMGGTIAMVPGPMGSLIPAHSAAEIVSSVPLIGDVADLEIFQIENLDSPNIEPCHWSKLFRHICSIYDDFDAFIVTHGTDTMTYTSGATALALGPYFGKPVIFTGSQLPFINLGNDARSNLENATLVALKAIKTDVGEVMIVFAHRVLRAARTLKSSESQFDAFKSPAFPDLGTITANGVSFRPEVRIHPGRGPALTPDVKFDPNILTVDLIPGLRPQLLKRLVGHDDPETPCRALILRSLGAGNVPVNLLSTIGEIIDAGTPVFICTKFVGGHTNSTMYETGRRAVELGAIPTADMTDVMVQLKLMWLLGMGISEPDKLAAKLLENYIGEVSETSEFLFSDAETSHS